MGDTVFYAHIKDKTVQISILICHDVISHK